MASSAPALLLTVALACALSACTSETGHDGAGARPSTRQPPQSAPTTRATQPDPGDGPGDRTPRLVPGDRDTVPADLRRLVHRLVAYATGDGDLFPHARTIALALGGQAAGSIDHLTAARPGRAAWQTCPPGWELYGATSCPVDLLGPIRQAVANDVAIVYAGGPRAVTCAPDRTGLLPPGRVVVLAPSPRWRTCASDFALALVADGRGRLTAADLTLAEP